MGTVLTGNHEEYGWNGRAGSTALTGKELCHGVFGAVAWAKSRVRNFNQKLHVRSTPHPVAVTTTIITFLVGNPSKPSFATVTGWG